jgi:hypothetical protein
LQESPRQDALRSYDPNITTPSSSWPTVRRLSRSWRTSLSAKRTARPASWSPWRW